MSSLAELESRARARLAAFKEEQQESIDRAVTVLEVNAAAFGMGLLHGRTGAMRATFGVPWDLGFGVLLLLGSFSGYAKGYENHLAALGNGCLAYYTGSVGVSVGQKMRQKTADWRGSPYSEEEAKKAGLAYRPAVTAGQLGQGAPYAFSPQQQAAMGGWG